jgi:hypothetical protein
MCTHVKLVWVLAQGSVVLLDKVPANLILRWGAVRGGCVRSRSGVGWGAARLPPLLLVVCVAVCCHGAVDSMTVSSRIYVVAEEGPRVRKVVDVSCSPLKS